MSYANSSDRCPVCAEVTLQAVMSISGLPVHCNLLWDDRLSAMNAPRGDIQLVFCETCGHISNRAFDPSLTEYTQAYENSLHFSPRFQEFASSLAGGLVARHDLHGRQLVEIGAGQGDFLRMLCELGDNRGIGFDEAYVAPEGGEKEENLTFVKEFAWQDHIENTPDMIYARHVLEHIQQPAEFVAVIRKVIGDHPDTLLFLEVPNAAYTLRELAIWDIIYEHCGYFTAQSLSYLLSCGGFDVLETREVFGDQFLTIEALPQDAAAPGECEPKELHELAALVEAFADEFNQKVAGWRARLLTWHDEGKRVVAWGAGSKGVTFLNIMQAEELVPYIVDINPRKLGKFVVGTAQEIVEPEFLRDYKPDVVVLMNPLYRDEIQETLSDMGITAEIVAA